MNDKTYKESPERLLLGLVPDDGESIGNGKLQERFLRVADEHGLKVTERDFVALKESLITKGVLVRGRGRGGSVRRGQDTSDEFALDTQKPPSKSGKKQPARTASKRKQNAKRTKSDGEAKICSFPSRNDPAFASWTDPTPRRPSARRELLAAAQQGQFWRHTMVIVDHFEVELNSCSF